MSSPAPYRPANVNPVKIGAKLIGYVDKRSNGPLGYIGAWRIKDDGNADRIGATSSMARSITMVRQDYEDRTEPMRPWCVRTKNGSTVIVEATTERMALRRAQSTLRRWAENALEPANAHVADPEFDVFTSHIPALLFGEYKP